MLVISIDVSFVLLLTHTICRDVKPRRVQQPSTNGTTGTHQSPHPVCVARQRRNYFPSPRNSQRPSSTSLVCGEVHAQWGNSSERLHQRKRHWRIRYDLHLFCPCISKLIRTLQGSLHMIHGFDVAHAILAVHAEFSKAQGQQWIITDGCVYNWWDLASAWGTY